MFKKRPIISILVVAFCFCLLIAGAAQAEFTDVADTVKLKTIGLVSDPNGLDHSYHFSLTNMGENVLLTPIRFVVSGLENEKVVARNANGETGGGDIYFDYNSPSGKIMPGESVTPEPWQFELMYDDNFEYQIRILSNME